LSHSLAQLGASLFALAQNRFELFSIDLQEGRDQTLGMLFAALLFLLCLGIGLLLATLCLVLLFDESNRLAALAAVAGVYLAVGVIGLWQLARQRDRTAPMFATTLSEFAKDRQAMSPR